MSLPESSLRKLSSFSGLGVSVMLVLSGIFFISSGVQGNVEFSIGDLSLDTSMVGLVLVLFGLINLWVMVGPLGRAANVVERTRSVLEELLVKEAPIEKNEEIPGCPFDAKLDEIDRRARKRSLDYYQSLRTEELLRYAEFQIVQRSSLKDRQK